MVLSNSGLVVLGFLVVGLPVAHQPGLGHQDDLHVLTATEGQGQPAFVLVRLAVVDQFQIVIGQPAHGCEHCVHPNDGLALGVRVDRSDIQLEREVVVEVEVAIDEHALLGRRRLILLIVGDGLFPQLDAEDLQSNHLVQLGAAVVVQLIVEFVFADFFVAFGLLIEAVVSHQSALLSRCCEQFPGLYHVMEGGESCAAMEFAGRGRDRRVTVLCRPCVIDWSLDSARSLPARSPAGVPAGLRSTICELVPWSRSGWIPSSFAWAPLPSVGMGSCWHSACCWPIWFSSTRAAGGASPPTHCTGCSTAWLSSATPARDCFTCSRTGPSLPPTRPASSRSTRAVSASTAA